MNAERLLRCYEQIAEAPDAIGRLRRIILDLAVRGKLVPQDPTNEPASKLLTRIAEEKARLQIGGRKREPSESSKITPNQGRLPAGWVEVQGLDIFPTRSGNSKLIKGKLHSEPAEGLYPGYSAAGQDVWLDHWEHEGVAIILSAVGARCGKAFLATGKWSAVANTHIVWILSEITTPAFAMLHLNNEAFWVRSGGAQPFVKVTETLSRPFPLPPLAEQHRIVAKVDELMALCDRLEEARAKREATRDRLTAASLARLNAPDPDPATFANHARFALNALPALTTRPDQIKQLRQTILNLAVRGKLVPQDTQDEPASKSLTRIAQERSGPQAAKRARRNGEVDVSSLRADTPLATGWCWTNLDEVAVSMRYGTSTKCEYATPGVPVLRIPNVSAGVVSLDDIKFGPLSDGEIRDLALNAGDLLMIRSNGSLDIVGRSAIVTPEAEGMAFAGYLVRLRLSLANIKPEYVWLALNSTDVRDQIERPIRSAVGLKNVNLTEFGALTFPLPPLAEQLRIVARVDELMALCDQLEASLTNSDDTRRRLLDALLAEALTTHKRQDKAA